MMSRRVGEAAVVKAITVQSGVGGRYLGFVLRWGVGDGVTCGIKKQCLTLLYTNRE